MIDPAAHQLSDEELVAALGPLSLRSTLDVPSVARRSGRSVTDPESVADLGWHYEVGLFASPFAAPVAAAASPGCRAAVAASVAFQAVVAQVANPLLLAHRVLGIGLAASLTDVRWREMGWGTRFGLVELRRCDVEELVDVLSLLERDVVEPWLAILSDVVPVPERTLRGNAQAALWTAIQAVDALKPLVAAEWDSVGALGLTASRDTCCLIHHAGLVVCDECPRSVGTP